MIALALAALLVVILFGVGFAIHVLWWIAIVALVIWAVGFLLRGGSRRTWYYW
jgi:hypothetical protein